MKPSKTGSALPMQLSPTLPTGGIDLTDCDKEPIHIPGSVQPHGVLIAVGDDWKVRQISANAAAALGADLARVLGAPLEDLFGSEEVGALRKMSEAQPLDDVPAYLPAFNWNEKLWERTLHRHAGMWILELESWETASFPNQYEIYPAVRTTMGHLDTVSSLKEFCQAAAERLREFSGFDRVMVYRFLDDDTGQVYAEARREDMEPFLGLHYPASDIPQQARALFFKSWLRLLPDTGCLPVPMLAAAGEGAVPLDMSFTTIRSMSPIHMEYLRNMGVGASMSISIREGGRLWGLFACHHESPRYVPQSTRMACEFLAHMLSLQVGSKERDDYQDYRRKLEQANATLIATMGQTDDLSSALSLLSQGMLSAMDADGAAVSFAGEWYTVGRVPGKDTLNRLHAWLDLTPLRTAFHCRNLNGEAPSAGAATPEAAGVLAMRLTEYKAEYLLWFRGEYRHEVSWAGEPAKLSAGERLTPRKSFAAWTEEVRGKSKSWLPVEIESATALRHGVLEIIVRHIERLTLLNQELGLSNNELDSFTFIVSHDLKEPLSGIKHLVRFVLEEQAAALHSESVEMLETVVRLTGRLDILLDSLMEYSRVGRLELQFKPVDMQAELEDLLLILEPRLKPGNIEVRVPVKLPMVLADRERISELLGNLMINAAKYMDAQKAEHWIEITWAEWDEEEAAEGTGEGREPLWRFTVRDNGIGIDKAHHERIFQIFQRLHLPTEYSGGSGVGLTIARKVVERHGGRLWVESSLGAGSAFHFTLPRNPVPGGRP
ncbi:MAG: Phytochrome, two-component sensor histidine kinase [Verrucomicrobiaceae bacterium]|nr:Phytochrome, two-component sensor histidine kinase [Verrucomicrobiaceae bacterium]